MLTIFLKLILAHILGDFVLQSKKWVLKRRENVFYLLLHVMIHGILLIVFFLDDLASWWDYFLFITVAHLGIDSLKIYWERQWPYKPIHLFVIDQVLHVGVLLAVLIHRYGIPEKLTAFLQSDTFLLYVIAFLLITVVSPIFLRVFFSRWDVENDFYLKKKETLLNAGALIGIMERLLIVFCIQVGFLAGIGFLLGAKSIFRFGDLTKAKNTKFTEYILVGTLASFTIAIIIGYLLKEGLKHV